MTPLPLWGGHVRRGVRRGSSLSKRDPRRGCSPPLGSCAPCCRLGAGCMAEILNVLVGNGSDAAPLRGGLCRARSSIGARSADLPTDAAHTAADLHAYMPTRACIYAHACMHICPRVHAYMPTRASTRASTCACTCACARPACRVGGCVSTCVHMHVQHMHMLRPTCRARGKGCWEGLHTCTYMHTCRCTHTYPPAEREGMTAGRRTAARRGRALRCRGRAPPPASSPVHMHVHMHVGCASSPVHMHVGCGQGDVGCGARDDVGCGDYSPVHMHVRSGTRDDAGCGDYDAACMVHACMVHACMVHACIVHACIVHACMRTPLTRSETRQPVSLRSTHVPAAPQAIMARPP